MFIIIIIIIVVVVGRDIAVWIATRYVLDGPGIKSHWGRDFPHPSSPDGLAEGYPASDTTVTGSVLGVKRPRHDVDHTPPSSAEVKERVELYLCSPYGFLWPLLGRNLPLYLLLLLLLLLFDMEFSCHRPFLPGTSLEPAVIPTAQASSFTLQYVPYYV